MKFTFIKYNADASMLKVFGIVFPKYFNAASVTPQLIQNEPDRCTFSGSVFPNKADDPAARDLKGNMSSRKPGKRFRRLWTEILFAFIFGTPLFFVKQQQDFRHLLIRNVIRASDHSCFLEQFFCDSQLFFLNEIFVLR